MFLNIFDQSGLLCEFEPGNAQYFTPNFLTGHFLKECIKTQNLGKAQVLGALLAVVPLCVNLGDW